MMRISNKGFTPPFLQCSLRFQGRAGFTLPELLLAAAILAFVLVGLLALFVNCIILNETNRNFTLVYTAMQTKMEEIKDIAVTNFDCLFVTSRPQPPSPVCPGCASCFYNGDTFNLKGISSGKAKIEINYASYDSSNNLILSKTTPSNLKHIRIVACFKVRNRLIGNDINNCQSSPAELVTLIAK